MADAPYGDEIAARAMDEMGAKLWPEGPTLVELVGRFVQANCADAHLDAWIPMASPRMHPVLAYYFHGAALRLADRFIFHPKVANMALMFACINNEIFPGKSPTDVSELVLGLPMPAFDGSKSELIHMLGSDTVDAWLQQGLDGRPPSLHLQKFMEICDELAVDEAKNPEGLADLVSSIMHSLTAKKFRDS